MKSIVEIQFDSISPEGFSVGSYNDKLVFGHGILPGEKAKGELVHRKKKYYLRAEEITQASSHRILNKEDHYLSCSPFQITDYSYQIELKEQMLRKSFEEKDIKVNEYKNFVFPSEQWGYRTKVEYGFVSKEDGLHFSFFERFRKFRRIKLDPCCMLMSDNANEIGLKILKKLNEYGYTEFDMKSLTLRESKTNGDVLAILLFKKDHQEFEMEIDWNGGMLVAFSDPRSPASRIDNIYWKKGNDYLEEEVLGKKFRYGFESFFQNNIEMYEEVLGKIRKEIQDIRDKKREMRNGPLASSLKTLSLDHTFRVLDLYSGIGSIGLSISDLVSEVIGVEIINEAVEFATKNAEMNSIHNYKAILSPSEKIDIGLFEGIDVVILDPARPGLHQKVIDMLNQVKPKYIIYLSCNHITQARDIASLQENYAVESLQGYDFYPNTYHLESLAILKLK